METEAKSGAGLIRLLGLVVLTGLAGCFHLSRVEPLQRHFVLGGANSLTDGAAFSPLAEVTVGVRRLELASYLSTPFMGVRHGANQMSFSEFNRWGEGLEEGINRVVARTLVGRGLRDASVAPWPAGAHYDYVIQISVAHFEGTTPNPATTAEKATPGAGGAHLRAVWQIVRQDDGLVLIQEVTDYAPDGWAVGDYAGLVTLLEAGLDVLADDIVAGLVKLRAS